MYDLNAAIKPVESEVGKLGYQVLGTEMPFRALMANQAANERKAAAKQKEEDDRQEKLMASIANMKGKAIMSHDMDDIYAKQKGISDFTIKNIDGLRKGDPKALMEFNQMMTQLEQETDRSVVKRQNVERVAKQLIDNPTKYTKGSKRNLDNFIMDKANAGKSFDEGSLIFEGTDYTKELEGVSKMAREGAPKVYTSGTAEDGSSWTRETYNTSDEDVFKKDAKGNLINDETGKLVRTQKGLKTYLGDTFENSRAVQNSAKEQLMEADENTLKRYTLPDGNLDVKKFWVDNHINDVQHIETKREDKAAQEKKNVDADGNPIEKIKVNYTYTPMKDGKGRVQFEYANQADNTPMVITAPTNSAYKGQNITIKPIAANIDGQNTTLEADVILSEKQKQANRDVEETNAAIALDEKDKPESKKTPPEKIPYPEVVNLPYRYVKEIMANKFESDNIFDVQHGKVKKTVHLTSGTKESDDVWEYGGTSAPASEWIKNGWTQDKLKKHAKKK